MDRVIPIKSLETVLENGGTEDEFFASLAKQPCQDLDERLEQEYKQSKAQLNEIYDRVVEEKWNIPQLLEHMFPNASQSEREYYLWEKTGYPAFYSPRPGETSIHALIESLWAAKQLGSRNQAQCDCCGKVILGEGLCEKCKSK